ncbi:Coatomer subunit delta [Cryptosporidium felis]|nr:Coatomer subunit delta [Cryptosporidium felis]
MNRYIILLLLQAYSLTWKKNRVGPQYDIEHELNEYREEQRRKYLQQKFHNNDPMKSNGEKLHNAIEGQKKSTFSQVNVGSHFPAQPSSHARDCPQSSNSLHECIATTHIKQTGSSEAHQNPNSSSDITSEVLREAKRDSPITSPTEMANSGCGSKGSDLTGRLRRDPSGAVLGFFNSVKTWRRSLTRRSSKQRESFNLPKRSGDLNCTMNSDTGYRNPMSMSDHCFEHRLLAPSNTSLCDEELARRIQLEEFSMPDVYETDGRYTGLPSIYTSEHSQEDSRVTADARAMSHGSGPGPFHGTSFKIEAPTSSDDEQL